MKDERKQTSQSGSDTKLIRPKREGWLWPGVGYDPRRQTALLELRWIERIVKRCGMALDIPKI